MVLHVPKLAMHIMMIITHLKQDHSVHTHVYHQKSQQLNSLADTEQQHQVYTSEVDTSLFTSDTSAQCESLFTSDTSAQCKFNITPNITEMETEKPIEETPQNNTSIHFHSKHKYQNT